jgi:tRNA(adenine34) deaminase
VIVSKQEEYMLLAIAEANKALPAGDVPIGAVVVFEDEVIGNGYNQVEKLDDSTAHAEMIAIREAIRAIGYKHLLDCELYVTLEPCAMCAGASVLARLNKIVFGAYDPKAGACGSVLQVADDSRLNHTCEIIGGVLEEECSAMLKDFFKKLRMRNKNAK